MKWRFEEFSIDLIQHFNNPTTLAAITGAYFGKRQQQGGSDAHFFKIKQRQADRIDRDAVQDISTLIALMHPEMSLYFRTYPTDLRSLRNEAIELESSLGSVIKPRKHFQTVNSPNSNSKSLPKCRLCPGFHWHNDCPTQGNSILKQRTNPRYYLLYQKHSVT